MPHLRVGISGWTYAPWRGSFYPKGLTQKRELEFASRAVNSIEINGSFYSLQKPDSYRLWHAQSPADFVFSLKGGRFITHMKKLKDVETPLANFFASGPLALEEKLGPILWQLPPSLGFDPARMAAFFDLLPRTTAAAADLARGHDARLAGRSLTEVARSRPLRHAVEVRHRTFECPEFVALLREHKVALVVADTAGKWPAMDDVTADFVYARLHGAEELYVSGYTDPALDTWAAKVRAWAAGHDAPAAHLTGPPAAPRQRGRDVYVYFDNDVKVRSPYDAMNLARRVGITPAGASPTAAAAPAPTDETARAHWPAIRRPPRGD